MPEAETAHLSEMKTIYYPMKTVWTLCQVKSCLQNYQIQMRETSKRFEAENPEVY